MDVGQPAQRSDSRIDEIELTGADGFDGGVDLTRDVRNSCSALFGQLSGHVEGRLREVDARDTARSESKQ